MKNKTIIRTTLIIGIAFLVIAFSGKSQHFLTSAMLLITSFFVFLCDADVDEKEKDYRL